MMKNIDWFNEARYGLFIHWGAYSVAARGEWVMNRELIPPDEYRKLYAEKFMAENFDPSKWAELAKRWGMGYTVLTARHHDGFALWNSEVNPFNTTQIGPKRDLLAEYIEAVRAADLKVGVYYSPANWTHPDYPGAFFRDWPGGSDIRDKRQNRQNNWKDRHTRRRFIEYYRAELKELLNNYGKIDYLWFDGCIPHDLDGDDTIELIREWQPDMLINNRLGDPYDVKVSEQKITPAEPGKSWEACITLSQTWGYHAGDDCWKSPKEVLKLLLDCAGNSGNLLINVGPKPDGTIQEAAVKILDDVGNWIKDNRDAVSASQRHPFSWNSSAKITARDNKVFLNFLLNPGRSFCWGELQNKVTKAYWLDTKEELKLRQEGERLFFDEIVFSYPGRTAVLEIKGIPSANAVQRGFWILDD